MEKRDEVKRLRVRILPHFLGSCTITPRFGGGDVSSNPCQQPGPILNKGEAQRPPRTTCKLGYNASLSLITINAKRSKEWKGRTRLSAIAAQSEHYLFGSCTTTWERRLSDDQITTRLKPPS